MIETERLILRAWVEADRAPFAAINADPAVMTYLGPPLDKADSDAGINRMIALAQANQPFFMAAERKRDKSLLGFIGVKPITFEAPFGSGYEIGWRLGSRFWGEGYASEGAKACLTHAFDTLPIDTIFSFTAVHNRPSQAVMARIGMVRVDEGDFDHPNLPATDPLRRHVLFRASRPSG